MFSTSPSSGNVVGLGYRMSRIPKILSIPGFWKLSSPLERRDPPKGPSPNPEISSRIPRFFFRLWSLKEFLSFPISSFSNPNFPPQLLLVFFPLFFLLSQHPKFFAPSPEPTGRDFMEKKSGKQQISNKIAKVAIPPVVIRGMRGLVGSSSYLGLG